MRRFWWALLVLVIAGCTNVKAGNPTASFASATPVDPGDLPATEVVWTVFSGGGMVPPTTWAPDLASIAIYGDGTAYLTSWDEGLTAVDIGSVDPGELHDFLADAAGSGLFDGVDYGLPGITDMITTTVQAYYDGTLHDASAYALGETSGLTGKQKKSREALTELMDAAKDLVTDLAPYDAPERVEVYLLDDVDMKGAGGAPWPGPALETFLTEKQQTCGELTGADATTAYQAFKDSKGEFIVNGQPTPLQINILLPGMTACD